MGLVQLFVTVKTLVQKTRIIRIDRVENKCIHTDVQQVAKAEDKQCGQSWFPKNEQRGEKEKTQVKDNPVAGQRS